jgi:hypothetical protein
MKNDSFVELETSELYYISGGSLFDVIGIIGTLDYMIDCCKEAVRGFTDGFRSNYKPGYKKG